MEGLNSNLDLNGQASPRVQPRIGEWGPVGAPTTGEKRLLRWRIVTYLVLVTAVIALFGYWVYSLLT